ncbi:MAG: hypothetical protein Q8O81_04100 [Giesbergeria sp.]|nr:hypothetical protein [Giesbergeria sp.]
MAVIGPRACLRSRPTTIAHNALGQRVFKTEALYNASASSLQGDKEEEDPGQLQSIQQFFTRLWSPKASDAEHLGWAYLYDENASLLGDYGMGWAASGGQGQYNKPLRRRRAHPGCQAIHHRNHHTHDGRHQHRARTFQAARSGFFRLLLSISQK